MKKTFHSNINYLGAFNAEWSTDVIKNEPMLFNSDLDFAYQNGGPITKEFIRCLPNDWKTEGVVFDSRVHMLMKGWFPCIPGWHHDDVPRSTSNGQPNYKNPKYQSKHILGLVNADVAPTEFAEGIITLDVPESMIYKVWHPQVEDAIRTNNLTLNRAVSGLFYGFNNHTFHQGVRATKDGWRWFARVSKDTDRSKNITNEIRKQVQVYLEYPMEGW